MYQIIHLLRIHRNGLLATLLLVTALLLIFSVRIGKESLLLFNEIVLDSVVTVQQVVRSPVTAYREAALRIQELLRLEEDNRRLRAELARVSPKLAIMEEVKHENHRLHSLLSMTEDPLFRMVGAHVVGSSSSAFSRVMTLDAGTDKGVFVDAPILSAKGLVGRIVEVGRRSSVALSILDPNSRVPTLVQRSRVQAIVAGRNTSLLSLEFVATSADVRTGDVIVTSGIGGIFPKGLPVGRISSVQPHGSDMFQKVAIRSAVDFDRLEEVNIVLPLFNAKDL